MLIKVETAGEISNLEIVLSIKLDTTVLSASGTDKNAKISVPNRMFSGQSHVPVETVTNLYQNTKMAYQLRAGHGQARENTQDF